MVREGKPIRGGMAIALNLIFAGLGFFYLRKWGMGFLFLIFTILAHLIFGIWGSIILLIVTMIATGMEADKMVENHETLKPVGGELFLIIIGVIFILIVGSILIGIKTFMEPTATPTQIEQKSGISEEKSKTYAFDINEKVTFGDFAYKINGAELREKIVGKNFIEEADELFLIIDLSVKNIASTQSMFSDDLIKVEDSSGKEYSTTSLPYTVSESGNYLSYKTLNPSQSLSGKIVFEVPESFTSDTSLKLRLESGKFQDTMHDNRIYVNLGNTIRIISKEDLNNEMEKIDNSVETLGETVYASPKNFDSDAEIDGIVVSFRPSDVEGNTVHARGKITARLWIKECVERMDYYDICTKYECQKDEEPSEEWVKTISREDYSSYSGAEIKLEYSKRYPKGEEDHGGCIEITFTSPSGKTLSATDTLYGLN